MDQYISCRTCQMRWVTQDPVLRGQMMECPKGHPLDLGTLGPAVSDADLWREIAKREVWTRETV